MEIIKYDHACFAVVKNGAQLVVDPGAWTRRLELDHTVEGIVITHGHADHYSDEHIETIVENNPEAVIYAPADVAAQHPDRPIIIIEPNKIVHVGDFALQFVGGEHAAIDESTQTPQNYGVMIDESLYYPGDSFTLPPAPVQILALPVAAPWLKFSEAAAFLREIRPTHAFPTHDAILSDAGKELADTMFSAVSEEIGTSYSRL